MVQAWYLRDDIVDRQAENHKDPPEYVSLDDLYKKTGVKCVAAWYMADNIVDKKLENHVDPPQYVSLEILFEKTGVECLTLNLDTYERDGSLERIKKEKGIQYEDQIDISEKGVPNYVELLDQFWTEHLHNDEEIRFVLEGAAYFDVRDGEERWLRILVTPGDLAVLPAAIYHRFTPLNDSAVVLKRLFTTEPVWKSFPRPADQLPSRHDYLQRLRSAYYVLRANS